MRSVHISIFAFVLTAMSVLAAPLHAHGAGPVQPSLSAFSPTVQNVGSLIRISGTGLDSVNGVWFTKSFARTAADPAGTIAAKDRSSTSMDVAVPAGLPEGEYYIVLGHSSGSARSQARVSVTRVPAVVSFSPASGGQGTVVRLDGFALESVASVSLECNAVPVSAEAEVLRKSGSVMDVRIKGCNCLDNRFLLDSTRGRLRTDDTFTCPGKTNPRPGGTN